MIGMAGYDRPIYACNNPVYFSFLIKYRYELIETATWILACITCGIQLVAFADTAYSFKTFCVGCIQDLVKTDETILSPETARRPFNDGR